MFLGKGVLKICIRFTGEQRCRNVISKKLLCNFIEITLRHGYSPVNLLQIFRKTFLKNTYGGLLLWYIAPCYLWFADTKSKNPARIRISRSKLITFVHPIVKTFHFIYQVFSAYFCFQFCWKKALWCFQGLQKRDMGLKRLWPKRI